MTKFKINDELEIVCEWGKTRNGFKHTATLLRNGRDIDSAKCNYLNRTWESFEYQTVMQELLDKTNELTEAEKKEFMANALKKTQEEIDKQFGLIGSIAKLGEILGKDQKESNDWKARMLKAGLENKGLIMPEDWDGLSEDEKSRRLDGVIGILNEKTA